MADKSCNKCGKQDPLGVDIHGLCVECREKSGLGPDLTCAMLGRGERGFDVIKGVNRQGKVVGCCPECHQEYQVGEVLDKNGHWIETCCFVRRTIENMGRLKWSPFSSVVH